MNISFTKRAKNEFVVTKTHVQVRGLDSVKITEEIIKNTRQMETLIKAWQNEIKTLEAQIEIVNNKISAARAVLTN